MNITGAIILYAVLWFIILFILVPIGYVSQEESGRVVPGTPSGAPAKSRLGRKMLWAAIIAGVFWIGCAYLILGGLISREDVMGWDQLIR